MKSISFVKPIHWYTFLPVAHLTLGCVEGNLLHLISLHRMRI